MTEKRATDILQDILDTVKLLSKQYANIDSNMKIMLQRTNALSKQLESKMNIGRPLQPQMPLQPPKRFVSPNQVEIAAGLKELETLSKEKKNAQTMASSENTSPVRIRGQHQNAIQDKVSVSQTIVYPDGRKLFMANVEIFQNGELVHQARTSPKGKWIVPLSPGEYSVHVSKRDGETKKLVELKYDIEVPESNDSVVLESPIIRG